MKHILFEDDFNGDSLKPVWSTRTHDGDPRATDVSDGQVHLRTLPNPVGGWLSGHIGTQGAFDFTYGWVEARIRFHPFHGSHACLWLAPSTDYEVGQSEVDIVEFFASHNPARKSGVNLYHNVYWREAGQVAGQFTKNEPVEKVNSADWGTRWDTWHRYKLHWTPKAYTFYIDGKVTAVINQGLSAKPHFLVLSMLTRDYEEKNLHHGHVLPVMDVDWIKVWRTE